MAQSARGPSGKDATGGKPHKPGRGRHNATAEGLPWALAWHIIIKQCQDTGLPEQGKSDCERRQTLADTKQPSGFYTMAVGLFIFLW